MKYLFTIIASLYIISLAMAQSSSNQDEVLNPKWHQSGDFALGVYIGLSNNTLSLHDVGDLRIIEIEDINGIGYLIGFQSDYFFGNSWSIKGRFNYESRNYGLGSSDNSVSTTVEAAWHFGKNRRWHLAVGPAYNVSLDGNLDISFGSNSRIDETFGSNEGSIDSDFGGAFSIGFIIPVSDLSFFIELASITQLNTGDLILTDSNGTPAGAGTYDTNRSSINIGILF